MEWNSNSGNAWGTTSNQFGSGGGSGKGWTDSENKSTSYQNKPKREVTNTDNKDAIKIRNSDRIISELKDIMVENEVVLSLKKKLAMLDNSKECLVSAAEELKSVEDGPSADALQDLLTSFLLMLPAKRIPLLTVVLLSGKAENILSLYFNKIVKYLKSYLNDVKNTSNKQHKEQYRKYIVLKTLQMTLSDLSVLLGKEGLLLSNPAFETCILNLLRNERDIQNYKEFTAMQSNNK